ncbi:hypothetical protein, partial [Sphingopyxis sp. KK2]|uniref:hypothetical protein n=1 Tax=Sphingopyxis sp. KK2 TaxID=1855727 RepID=UPI001C4DE630
ALAIIRSRRLAPASSGMNSRLGPGFVTGFSFGRGPMPRRRRQIQRGMICLRQARFSATLGS